VSEVRWVTALLDTPDAAAPASEQFWRDVTGTRLSPRHGSRQELVTLVPAQDDPYLKAQRVGRPVPGGLHLDLHTDDVPGLAVRAQDLGATTHHHLLGAVACGSPGGLSFCLVPHPGRRRPPAHPWPGGASVVDQVVPGHRARGVRRGVRVLGGADRLDPTTGDHVDEFTRLVRPDQVPLAFLLQRLDDEAPAVSAHLDLAADDRGSETARHEALGARVLRRTEGWTVLEDPTGRVYCITARSPGDV
jgi:hypothetical protein